MSLYLLEPEVAGGHGEKTVYHNKSELSRIGQNNAIKFLHYEFDGWLGDDLLESTPIFVVSKKLGEALKSSSLTGFTLRDCLITVSETFEDLYPNKVLPTFTQLIPTGDVSIDDSKVTSWSGHDFCFSDSGYLVVSQKAVNLLKAYSLSYCDIVELH